MAPWLGDAELVAVARLVARARRSICACRARRSGSSRRRAGRRPGGRCTCPSRPGTGEPSGRFREIEIELAGRRPSDGSRRRRWPRWWTRLAGAPGRGPARDRCVQGRPGRWTWSDGAEPAAVSPRARTASAAAGGVVWRPSRRTAEVEVLLVHRPQVRRLEPAQGQVRRRASATRTRRVREVLEETGLRLRAGRRAGRRRTTSTAGAGPRWCATGRCSRRRRRVRGQRRGGRGALARR